MGEPAVSLGPPVLFVEDLERSKAFYTDVLGLSVGNEDSTSAGMVLGDDMILLVTVDSARDMLIGETPGTPRGNDPTLQFCLFVDNVDAWFERLSAMGVDFFIEPMDRYWGRRTAHFRDPDGFLWEISQAIG
jgi:catechol 2,3-dioxygenase-like lactoylglutathione lyase family enzyme